MNTQTRGIIIGAIALFAAILTVTAVASAAVTNTYYVSVTGSDTTGDGTASNPWRTIQFAVDNNFSNG